MSVCVYSVCVSVCVLCVCGVCVCVCVYVFESVIVQVCVWLERATHSMMSVNVRCACLQPIGIRNGNATRGAHCRVIVVGTGP